MTRGVRQGCPLSQYLFILAAELMAIAIRYSQKISGIIVGEKELKISSYADDTTLFIDGSSISINTTVDILHNFPRASGLKINYSKSEAMKIGSLILNEDLQPPGEIQQWTKGPVRLIGVKLSHNDKELFNLNYNPQIDKIKTILNLWSRRDLTPIGKITLVKSLALSQLTFLLTVLPNPPQKFISEVNTLIYRFIWNGKCDKISRKVVVNSYANGGLKMLNLECIQKSLKSTWIKRLLDEPEIHINWKCFINNILTQTGLKDILWSINISPNEFPYHILKDQFLIDIVRAWLEYKYHSRLDEDELLRNISSETIWYNYNIKINNRCIFYKSWNIEGVVTLKDLCSENGSLLSFEEFKLKYRNIKCTFICYYGLLKAIPKIWKEALMRGQLAPHDHIPSLISELCKQKKTSQIVYKSIVQSVCQEPLKCQQKWSNILGNINNWKEVFETPFKVTRDPKLQYFQFKFINFLIPTNTFLYKIGKKDTEMCFFCNEFPERLIHLFWECEKVIQFWIHVIDWLNSTLCKNNSITLKVKDICFGFSNDPSMLITLIIILAKSFIFNRKYKEDKNLNLSAFKNYVHTFYVTEECIAITKGSTDQVKLKWKNMFVTLTP